MKELSMHILDIATNSVRADAHRIDIYVEENLKDDQFIFEIKDDGKGIPEEMLKTIKDPFTTTRTHRKVGLGIPFLDENCRLCDGYLTITSTVGVGTQLKSMLRYHHIDRPPMGDIVSTVVGLMTSNEEIDIHYTHKINEKEFELSTSDLKEELEDVPLTQIDVIQWLRSYIKENLDELRED